MYSKGHVPVVSVFEMLVSAFGRLGPKIQISKQIAIGPIREETSVVSHGDQLNQVSWGFLT